MDNDSNRSPPPPAKKFKSSHDKKKIMYLRKCISCRQYKTSVEFSKSQKRKQNRKVGFNARCKTCVNVKCLTCARCQETKTVYHFDCDLHVDDCNLRESPAAPNCKWCMDAMQFSCSRCHKSFHRRDMYNLPWDATPETISNIQDSLLCNRGCQRIHTERPRACVKCGIIQPKSAFHPQVWGNGYYGDCKDERELECLTCLPRLLYDQQPRLQEIAKYCRPLHRQGVHFYMYPKPCYHPIIVKEPVNDASYLERSYKIFYLYSYDGWGNWGKIETHQRTVNGALTITKLDANNDLVSSNALLTIALEQNEKDPDDICNLNFKMVFKNGQLEPHRVQSKGHLKEELMRGNRFDDTKPIGELSVIKERFAMPFASRETDEVTCTGDRLSPIQELVSVKKAEEAIQRQRTAPKWMDQMAPKHSSNDCSPAVCLDQSLASKVWAYVQEAPSPALFLEPGDLILEIDWYRHKHQQYVDCLGFLMQGNLHVLVARKKS